VWEQVIVDAPNKKIKPVAVNARTTLILRNIPTDAPEAEVRALITGDKWPKMVGLRSDVGDNWFVSFETEDQTKTALEMAKGMKFKDKSISCAIKSENLLKGLQPGSPPKGAPTNGMYAGPGMYGGYMPNGGYGWNGGFPAGEGGFGRGGARAGPAQRGGHTAGPGGGAAPVANGVVAPEDGNARNGNKRKNPKARDAREGRDAQGASSNAEKKVEQAPINLNDFPSLAGSAPTNTGTGYRSVHSSSFLSSSTCVRLRSCEVAAIGIGTDVGDVGWHVRRVLHISLYSCSLERKSSWDLMIARSSNSTTQSRAFCDLCIICLTCSGRDAAVLVHGPDSPYRHQTRVLY